MDRQEEVLVRSKAYYAALEQLCLVDPGKSSELYAVISVCVVLATHTLDKSDALFTLSQLHLQRAQRRRRQRWQLEAVQLPAEYLQLLERIHTQIDIASVTERIEPTRELLDRVVFLRAVGV
jgi:hypothetical protein